MIKEYIVTRDILNIRSRATDESDDTYRGQLLKGARIWLYENDVIGVIPKGGESNLWKIETSSRNFVAADGVKPINYEDIKKDFLRNTSVANLHKNTSDESIWKVSWGNVLLDIWKLWNHEVFPTQGEGVNIAIVDSGIDLVNSDLVGSIADMFYAPSDGGSMADTVGHGTKSAGLISATGESLIYGIAPLSKLFVAKRNDIKGRRTDEYHEKSFQWILEADKKNKIDIVSLSFNCNRTPKMDELLDEMNERNIIVVAAAGNTGVLEDDLYPACYGEVISIASLTKELKRKEDSSFNSNTQFILPGDNLLSTGITNNDRYHTDTSAATPIFAGILALLVSLRNRKIKQFDNKILLETLNSTAISISEDIDSKVWTWKIPQPLFTLSKI